MNIVTISRIKNFYQKHADAKIPLQVWVARMSELKINTLNDLRQVVNTVDVIGNNRVIFDVKGNKYRNITVVLIPNQTIYIRWIGTHADYDRIDAHTV